MFCWLHPFCLTCFPKHSLSEFACFSIFSLLIVVANYLTRACAFIYCGFLSGFLDCARWSFQSTRRICACVRFAFSVLSHTNQCWCWAELGIVLWKVYGIVYPWSGNVAGFDHLVSVDIGHSFRCKLETTDTMWPLSNFCERWTSVCWIYMFGVWHVISE
jgi:hypothetical protein